MTDLDLAFAIPPPQDAGDEDSSPSSHSAPVASTSSSHKDKDRSKKRKAKHDAPAPVVVEEEPAAPAEPVEDEEKVLSHKEKRQLKKRKLAAEAAGEDPDLIDSPVAPAAAEGKKGDAPPPTMIGGTLVGNTPARSAHGVWIGNMNFATHPRELLAWFAERGLKDVTRINMPNGKRSHENNRGCAHFYSLISPAVSSSYDEC